MTKRSMENIMRLILEEVLMSDRHMSDRQLYLFLQIFFKTKEISLNWRLDSIVTDYVAYMHCDSTLINNGPRKIYVYPR